MLASILSLFSVRYSTLASTAAN
uniref:Uncharacterized protein n=1 Tax=Rhizophora mucronata TaxID=61149 RepID=A0A2P2QIP9_RHIMU